MPRPLLTGWAATAIATSVLAVAGLAGSGEAASAATAQPGQAQVSVAITSVSPAFARPGQTVTVSGSLTNTSSGPMAGLSIQLRSSSTPFGSRNQLQEYASGSSVSDTPVPGAVTAVTGTVAPRATVGWSVALRAGQVPMSVFGVYPLAAEADRAGLPLTADRTFLPFWPGTKAADPRAQDIAWTWPLIDQPRQAMCAGLLNNGLEASLSGDGRLSGLLDTGAAYAGTAHLTWVIDPALLANVSAMTSPYQAGDSAGCQGAAMPASRAAQSWLAQLKSATAGQPVVVTPYADADIAALTGNGLNTDLTRAFTEGRSVAGKILGRSFAVAPGDSGASLNGTAWPADGIADYAVLENLAASDGINTVVLDSSTMPPSPPQDYTPSAQSQTPDGEGPDLKVLLSDDTITRILGSANSPSASKAAAFATAQRYLAETAMIAAEQPGLARSIVVAPPRRWDPPAGLAGGLLAETVNAPWLRPVSLGQLAAARHPSGQVSRQAPAAVSRAELGRPLLAEARQLEQRVELLRSIQVSPDPAVDAGVAAVESSAWRGGGKAGQQGLALARQISGYLAAQESLLTIIGPPRVTLGGLKGTVPVSISNGLGYPVRVRLAASGRITLTRQPQAVVVQAGQQKIIRVAVAAAAVGSTTLRLRLLTPQGAPFPAQATMTIQATNYGTLALVIIAAALGVFVLTSAARAFRRARGMSRPGPPPGDPPRRDAAGAEAGAEPPGGAPGPGREPHGTQPERGMSPGPLGRAPAAPDRGTGRPDRPADPDEADTVGTDGITAGNPGAGDHDPAEETDDYAWTPGWADRR